MSESKLEINRRNILTVLGVAAVSTSAFASEQIDSVFPSPPSVPGLAVRSLETQERFALAFERAAAAIRSGEMTCHEMTIRSRVRLEEWFEHDVTFRFELGAPFAAQS